RPGGKGVMKGQWICTATRILCRGVTKSAAVSLPGLALSVPFRVGRLDEGCVQNRETRPRWVAPITRRSDFGIPDPAPDTVRADRIRDTGFERQHRTGNRGAPSARLRPPAAP